MAFQVSPGVNVSEIDLTQVIPAPATSIGAIAGFFTWGPTLKVTTIENEKQLAETFGKPRANTDGDTWFTAASFLAYAGDLRVVRNKETSGRNAVDSGTAVDIGNEEVYLNSFYELNSATANVAARYHGDVANGLIISVCGGSNFNSWTYRGLFDQAPNTTPYVKNTLGFTNANDEMHVVVVDAQGKFTGTANTVLERFPSLSKAKNGRTTFGEANWWRTVLQNKSKYAYVIGNPQASASGGFAAWDQDVTSTVQFVKADFTFTLAGGVSGTGTAGATETALTKFETDEEGNEISLLMCGKVSGGGTQVEQKAIDIAEARKDIVVFVSPDKADVVDSAAPTTDVTDYRTTLNRSSSYAVMDSGWKYMWDRYNEIYRWVPLNGDIAGLCARTDDERDPWYSPAGLQRGRLRNVIKLAFNPTKTQRDTLYKAGVNPVISTAGDGTLLFGDKTLQGYASAFDRINVRRLFIVLEKAVARAARTSLFEFNDEFTRAQFVNLVEPFLRTVQGRRGIYDFRVVCDETNNTPDVIDRNEFVGDIYVQPARSVNFVQLNFVAVSTGVSFEEIVGQAF